MRARPPRDFLDPGAFDARGYLAGQGIDLTGSLRSATSAARRSSRTDFSAAPRARPRRPPRPSRRAFRAQPQQAALLRAMLLGDRSFVDSEIVVAFQKTAAYHVLVVAGLHVGALAAIIFWLCRRLRFSIAITSLITLRRARGLRGRSAGSSAHSARRAHGRRSTCRAAALPPHRLAQHRGARRARDTVVEAFVTHRSELRPFISRRRCDRGPGSPVDGSIERALSSWSKLSGRRDAGQRSSTRVAQFRIELRAASARLAALLPQWLAPHAQALTAAPVRVGLRLWEIALLSLVIQWGMLPVLAQDFHRVSLAGPLSNVPAVLLTGLIVPLGFLMLAATFVWTRLAAALAHVLAILSGWLLATVGWFSRLPRVSYRIPQSPLWLLLLFFAMFVLLASAARAAASNRKNRRTRRQLPAPIALTEWLSGAALAVLTIFVAWHPFAPSLERGKLEVSVLDVGQGDSIFTAFPGGRTMLIDAGGLDGSERVGGYRVRHGCRRGSGFAVPVVARTEAPRRGSPHTRAPRPPRRSAQRARKFSGGRALDWPR